MSDYVLALSPINNITKKVFFVKLWRYPLFKSFALSGKELRFNQSSYTQGRLKTRGGPRLMSLMGPLYTQNTRFKG